MNDIDRILIPDFEIEKRVQELGMQIKRDYINSVPRVKVSAAAATTQRSAETDMGGGLKLPLLMVGVLRGAFVFLADLCRAADMPVEINFVALSSYAGTESTGRVRIVKDLEQSVEGRDVLIVEDIIDTGITLAYLKELLNGRKPASLKICALLDKPSRRKADIQADYVGFTVPDEFLVGCGLDFDGKYRNLRDICVLRGKRRKEEVRS